MNIEIVLKDKLISSFHPTHLELVNESYKHNVPEGSESHFNLVIVSALFENKRQVARHQSVYKTLGDEMSNGIHALAIHTYTPAEWKKTCTTDVAASPPCLGGGKQEH